MGPYEPDLTCSSSTHIINYGLGYELRPENFLLVEKGWAHTSNPSFRPVIKLINTLIMGLNRT